MTLLQKYKFQIKIFKWLTWTNKSKKIDKTTNHIDLIKKQQFDLIIQQSRGNDRSRGTFRPNRGGFNEKRRGIKKDVRGPPHKFRNDRQDRGPQRNYKGNRDDEEVQRSDRDQGVRNRISRAPRKPSPQNLAQNAQQQKGRTLKVMGLHPDFTNQDLYKLFSTQGALQKCLIEQDNFGRSMTTAIVKYYNISSAKTAIANLNQHKVMNSILTVQPYKNIRR